MSGLRTSALLCVVLLVLARPAAASDEIYNVFAGCAGRFSAEMEHAWLMGDAAADEYESQRHTFISLTEAAIPAEKTRAVLHHRLDHKLAHASLLTIATFGQDDRRARAARSAAKAYRQACEQLLLRG
ncbi:MAG: hypothetical protein AB3N11_10975 [Arenibacterium sp.]